jgi:hypothetical protein
MERPQDPKAHKPPTVPPPILTSQFDSTYQLSLDEKTPRSPSDKIEQPLDVPKHIQRHSSSRYSSQEISVSQSQTGLPSSKSLPSSLFSQSTPNLNQNSSLTIPLPIHIPDPSSSTLSFHPSPSSPHNLAPPVESFTDTVSVTSNDSQSSHTPLASPKLNSVTSNTQTVPCLSSSNFHNQNSCDYCSPQTLAPSSSNERLARPGDGEERTSHEKKREKKRRILPNKDIIEDDNMKKKFKGKEGECDSLIAEISEKKGKKQKSQKLIRRESGQVAEVFPRKKKHSKQNTVDLSSIVKQSGIFSFFDLSDEKSYVEKKNSEISLKYDMEKSHTGATQSMDENEKEKKKKKNRNEENSKSSDILPEVLESDLGQMKKEEKDNNLHESHPKIIQNRKSHNLINFNRSVHLCENEHVSISPTFRKKSHPLRDSIEFIEPKENQNESEKFEEENLQNVWKKSESVIRDGNFPKMKSMTSDDWPQKKRLSCQRQTDFDFDSLEHSFPSRQVLFFLLFFFFPFFSYLIFLFILYLYLFSFFFFTFTFTFTSFFLFFYFLFVDKIVKFYPHLH